MNELRCVLGNITRLFSESSKVQVTGGLSGFEAKVQECFSLKNMLNKNGCRSLNQVSGQMRIPLTAKTASTTLSHLDVWVQEWIRGGMAQRQKANTIFKNHIAALNKCMQEVQKIHSTGNEAEEPTTTMREKQLGSEETSFSDTLFHKFMVTCKNSEKSWSNKTDNLREKVDLVELEWKKCQDVLRSRQEALKSCQANLQKTEDERHAREKELAVYRNQLKSLQGEYERCAAQYNSKIAEIQAEHDRDSKSSQRSYEREVRKLGEKLQEEKKSAIMKVAEVTKDFENRIRDLEKQMSEERNEKAQTEIEMRKCRDKQSKAERELECVTQLAHNIKMSAEQEFAGTKAALQDKLKKMEIQIETTKDLLDRAEKEKTITLAEKLEAERKLSAVETKLSCRPGVSELPVEGLQNGGHLELGSAQQIQTAETLHKRKTSRTESDAICEDKLREGVEERPPRTDKTVGLEYHNCQRRGNEAGELEYSSAMVVESEFAERHSNIEGRGNARLKKRLENEEKMRKKRSILDSGESHGFRRTRRKTRMKQYDPGSDDSDWVDNDIRLK